MPEEKVVETAKAESERILKELNAAKAQLQNVGLLQFNLKKELQAKCDKPEKRFNKATEAHKKALTTWQEASKPLKEKQAELKIRQDAAKAELNADRGVIAPFDNAAIPDAVADGRFTITANQFIAQLSERLPAPTMYGQTRMREAINGEMIGVRNYNIIDQSLTSDNKNTGVSFVIETVPNSPIIKKISVQAGVLRAEEMRGADKMLKWCELGSYGMLLAPTLTPENAENLLASLAVSAEHSRFGHDDVSIKLNVSFGDIVNSVIAVIKPNDV